MGHKHHEHEHTHTLSADEIVTRGLQTLKNTGFKMTKKREEILRIFAEDQRYLSAKHIHQHLSNAYPTMSYNTTYRNIYDFVENGILESSEYNGEQLFRINCWSCNHTHHHHHFICTECGWTLPLDVCPMDHVNTDLAGLQIDSHRFDIFGKCANCQQT